MLNRQKLIAYRTLQGKETQRETKRQTQTRNNIILQILMFAVNSDQSLRPLTLFDITTHEDRELSLQSKLNQMNR